MLRGLGGAPFRKDEPEKPFWISFSDMMTGLMALFLVAMATAFVYVAQVSSKEQQRTSDISQCMSGINSVTSAFPGIKVNEKAHLIDFGTRATFAYGRDDLMTQQQHVIQRFIPRVLAIARTPACAQWLKQIVVDGFASKRGQYLYNLDLSFKRAERILCILLANPNNSPASLSGRDRIYVAKRFFPGGSSSNSLKETDAESQRIEIRIEFLNVGEIPAERSQIDLANIGVCPI
jgi:flagellar motor protein MotB